MARPAAGTAEPAIPFDAGWSRLALLAGSPFLTTEWLGSWWSAFGEGEPARFVLRRPDGTLRAGGWFRSPRRGTLAGAANVHSGDWDVVAEDAAARRELWLTIAGTTARHVRLPALRDSADSSGVACDALAQAGYRVVREQGPRSPWLPLPSTWDELQASLSRNLRSQVGRRRRALEREGELALRTVSAPAEIDGALDALLHMEAAGWKGRSGTAILSDSRTERLYRRFAHAAAERGWLRLHLLELGGVPVAGEYGCVFSGGAFLVKTGFDERYARFSPGLVLRAEVLQAAIAEGCRSYDFLGGSEPYKLRWTGQLRPRITIRAYRGHRTAPAFAYRAAVRPALKRVRDAATRRAP